MSNYLGAEITLGKMFKVNHFNGMSPKKAVQEAVADYAVLRNNIMENSPLNAHKFFANNAKVDTVVANEKLANINALKLNGEMQENLSALQANYTYTKAIAVLSAKDAAATAPKQASAINGLHFNI